MLMSLYFKQQVRCSARKYRCICAHSIQILRFDDFATVDVDYPIKYFVALWKLIIVSSWYRMIEDFQAILTHVKVLKF